MAEEHVFSEAEVQEHLKELPEWEYRDGWIRRSYKTGGWPFTLMLVNAIGFAAEAAWHHPDLTVTWAEVKVRLMTHSAKGITAKDMELARRIETIATWQPEAKSALVGFETGFKKKWIR